MQDKNQVFNIIRDNLTRSYIFYIPERYYSYIEMTFIKDIIKPDMVNIITYSNLERKTYTNHIELNGFDVLNKENLLNDNIDHLIGQKETLSEIAFNHLVEQYKEHVDAHWLIISWMSKNVMKDIPSTPTIILGMFESQAFIFEKHQTKFNSYFGLQNTDQNIDINQYLKVASETVEEPLILETKKTVEKPSDIQELKKPPKKEEQEPLMTDGKARSFLLETVFNIDAKYLN